MDDHDSLLLFVFSQVGRYAQSEFFSVIFWP